MFKLYQYLFYKLYKFWEVASTPKFWSDAKAVLSIEILELFLVGSLIIYYRIFVNKNSRFGEGIPELTAIFIVIFIPNYFIFLHKKRWKLMIHEFDKWPRKKNKIGSIIALCVIAIVVAQFFLLVTLT